MIEQHMVAFSGATGTSFARLNPITDGVLAPSATFGFIVDRPMVLVAAYVAGSDLTQARIVIGSNPLAPAYVRPTSSLLNPPDDPNMMSLVDHPIRFNATEEVAVEVLGAGADAVAVLVLTEQHEKAPTGEPIWVEFESGVQTLSAATKFIWTAVPAVTYPKTLTPGDYAIVGMDAFNATTGFDQTALRAVVPGRAYRPGTLLMKGPGQRNARPFLDGSIGCMGYFSWSSPPAFQFLSSGAAGTVQVSGFLRVVQVSGDGIPRSYGGR